METSPAPTLFSDLTSWLHSPSRVRGIYAYGGARWQFHSYASVAGHVEHLVERLRDYGIEAGDRAAIVAPEYVAFVAALFAVLHRGAVAIPLAAAAPRGQTYAEFLCPLLKAAAPRAVLATPSATSMVRSARVRTDPWEVLPIENASREGHTRAQSLAKDRFGDTGAAILQFTSGSSGQQRAVVITHANLAANLTMISQWEQTDPGHDTVASWLPLHHDMGLVGHVLKPVLWQHDVWHMPGIDFLKHPEEWLRCFGLRGATLTAAPVFGYSYAARRVAPEQLEGCDFGHWHSAIVGAERIDAAGLRAFYALVKPFGFREDAFRPAYGLAEATLAVTGVPRDTKARMVRLPSGRISGGVAERADLVESSYAERACEPGEWIASSGEPLAGTAVRIVDGDRNTVPDGEVGEIAVTGPSVSPGYITHSRRGGTRFEDGELRTGDAGLMIDGELFVLGRMTESIKVRGRRVLIEPLEGVLAELAGVRPGQCVVVSASRSRKEAVAAVVETEPGAWVQGARRAMREHLGVGACVEVHCVARHTIPKTTSGKPRRRELWRRLYRGELEDSASPLE